MKSVPCRRSVVLCPRAKLPAAVELDDSLSIEACSRSASLDCNRDCLPQLSYFAQELDEFLALQPQVWCSICGSMLASDDWYASRMSAVSTNIPTGSDSGLGQTTGGDDQRICWNCYMENLANRRAAQIV